MPYRRRYAPAPRDWEHHSYAAGMVRDNDRHELPETAVWDALDVFIDEDGELTKRGGTSVVQSSASVLQFQQNSIGIMRSYAQDGIIMGYAFDTNGDIYTFNPGSGTTTLDFVDDNPGNRIISQSPFQFSNMMCCPYNTVSGVGGSPAMQILGGHVGGDGVLSSSFATSNPSVTAGSNLITGFNAGELTAKVRLGMFIHIHDVAQAIFGRYRITKRSATSITVEPTPTLTFTAASGTDASVLNSIFANGFCGCSYQGRLVSGDIVLGQNGERAPDAIMWSLLPQETGFQSAGATYDGLYTVIGLGGANQAFLIGPYYNYIRIPELTRVVAIVPVENSQLLVLGETGCFLITGNLTSESVSNPSLSVSVRQLTQGIGCNSHASVQRTVVGPMFTSSEGVMVYTPGGTVRNTMVGRIKNYWQFISNQSGFLVYGSAQLSTTHYYLSTSAGGFLCNLDGFRWTRLSNVDIWGSAKDKSSDFRVYSIRANPTSSSQLYKLIRIDKMLNPDSTCTTDADAANVTSSIQTRVYTGSTPSRLKKLKHAKFTVAAATGATVTITATPGLAAEETSQAMGTITGNAGATPQVIRADPNPQIISKGVAYTLSQTGACNTCEFFGIEEITRDLRRERIV